MKDECSYCPDAILAICLHNALSEIDDKVDILEDNSGNPRLRKLAIHFMDRPGVPTPSGILMKGDLLVNSALDVHHFYEFLKHLKARKEKPINI